MGKKVSLGEGGEGEGGGGIPGRRGEGGGGSIPGRRGAGVVYLGKGGGVGGST